MAAPKRYEITVKSVMQWAASELEHVGRIASLADPDIQYAYAMSTLNGMAHLKDALYELVTDPDYERHRTDLLRTHDAVVRTMRHLKGEYNLDLDAIRAFNTRGTLSDMTYLEDMNVGNVGNEEMVPMNLTANQDGGRRKYRNTRRYNSRRSNRRSNHTQRRH